MIVARTESHPRRQPTQMRSRATFDVILEAAAQILVKRGIAGFNTNDVASKAGVSIGSVYQYFPDKESLLAELKRRHRQALADSVQKIYENSHSRPMADTVRFAVRALIARHVVDPELHRMLEEEIIMFPEVGFPDIVNLGGIGEIRRFLEVHKEELVVEDLDLASFIIGRTFRNVISAALKVYPERLASGTIEDELTKFTMRYLTGQSVQ